MQSGLANWQTKRFTEMDGNEQYLATSNVIRTSIDVNSLYLGCAERAQKILILANSGGAITVLAYAYHSKNFTPSIWLSISFLSFVIGLLLVIDVIARDFDYMLNKSTEFNSDCQNFLLDNIPFSDIRRFQVRQPHDDAPRVTIFLGRLSAYCAVTGICIGVIGYMIA